VDTTSPFRQDTGSATSYRPSGASSVVETHSRRKTVVEAADFESSTALTVVVVDAKADQEASRLEQATGRTEYEAHERI